LQYNDADYATAIGTNSFNNFDEDVANEKTFDFGDIDVANDRITIVGHGFGANGTYRNLKFTQGTDVVPGLTTATIHQFKIISADIVEIITDTITGQGTGTGHKLTPQFIYTASTAVGYNSEPDAAYQVMLGNSDTTEIKTYGGFTNADNSNPNTFISQTRFGDVDNYLQVSTSGILTLEGTAKQWITLRPTIDVIPQVAHAKPTEVTIGVFHGFSMPIYASDNEELFFRQSVLGRWDGESDIIVHIKVCLAAAEDIGDYFKFKLSWEHAPEGEIVPTTSNDVYAEQAVLVGRNAQYNKYELEFIIDYDIDGVGNEIKKHETLGMRLQRVDATNPDVSGEIIVLDWHDHFRVNKFASTS